MVRTKRNSIISLCLVLVLMLSALVGFFAPQKSVDAAGDSDTQYGRPAVEGTDYDKVTLFEGNALKSGELTTLYSKLTGESNATFSQLENYVATDKNATNIRTNNNGKGVVVSFGGYDWWVVYLTKSKTDVIATLYMVEPISNSSGSYITSTWSSGWSANNKTAAYPSNMYGTSYIRCYLNNGGSYAGSEGCTTLTPYTSSDSNPFASVLALSDYIAKPSEVAYQETESAVVTLNRSYLLPNEAYGTPAGTGSYYEGYDYTTNGRNSDYTAWKDDYIWLPSYTETGYYMSDSDNKQGIWSLNEAETKFKNNDSSCWLRSGLGNYAYGAYLLFSVGYCDYDFVLDSYGVRPSLHLNLSTLESAGDAGTGVEIVVLPIVVMILSGFGIAFVNIIGRKKSSKRAI